MIDPSAQTEPAVLVEAFGAFSSAARTLEQSYSSLREEVERLRKELDRERDLRQRREALAEISALLAHEIRNPLGSMELFAGLLAGSGLGEQEKDWVEQIQSGLRILSATVNNILEFHAQRPLSVANTDLHAALRSVKSLLRPMGERLGVRWVAELVQKPLFIRADRHGLEQVFLNLALNAFRFAAQGGVLQVTTGVSRAQAVVRFADRGPGIAPDVLSTIFRPGVAGGTGGPGLGLAVTKRIVEQHGGTISVESIAGKGTCFELGLPLAETGGGQ
jgi:two-component system sensor histidine kinase FlrB